MAFVATSAVLLMRPQNSKDQSVQAINEELHLARIICKVRGSLTPLLLKWNITLRLSNTVQTRSVRILSRLLAIIWMNPWLVTVFDLTNLSDATAKIWKQAEKQ